MILPAAVLLALLPDAHAADGYGSVSGQVVFDGPKLTLKQLVAPDDKKVRDKCCTVKGVPNSDLLIDEKSKGISNVFIYIRDYDGDIHPDLKESKKKEISFDQKNCKFLPHSLLIRTDQKVLLKSDDNCTHNTNATSFFNNEQFNVVIQPKTREGLPVKFEGAESLPAKIECNIHPFMRAYWLILDHPYAAKTDKDGKFKIDKLPAGTYDFVVWHPKTLYLRTGYEAGKAGKSRRGFKVEIKADGDTNIGKVTVDRKALRELSDEEVE
ncbi:MAG: hypothetical protein CMJ78_05285 [Planctomycetaceae bacterium]|nr:hypothetical protein [Planctomycetaceae bacterium]